MTKYLLIIFLFATSYSYAQQKEDRSGGQFSAISIGIPANVHISKGREHKVTLEGKVDDLEEIETEISGGKLRITFKNESWWGGSRNISRINVYITTQELSEVNLSGSGTVTSKDIFVTSSFDADISGSGKMDLNIEAEETDINISGSGKVILKGKSKEADIQISGSGDVEAIDFSIGDADINIMGSGNCTVQVSEKLSSTIMGSGNVRYSGNPKHVNNNSMGSGSIKKL